MKIWVGADHRGRDYKEIVKEVLSDRNIEVNDVGVFEDGSADYPDYALAVAGAVRDGLADRGVLVCASGIGMSIAANKVRGVRAALCCNTQMAETARAHNDANVLCLGQDICDERTARAILKTWLDTGFDAGRHQRRLSKIEKPESFSEQGLENN